MYCRAYGTPSTKLPPLTGLTTNMQELFRNLKLYQSIYLRTSIWQGWKLKRGVP